MTNQSIGTMTINELESLINKLIDERVNQNQVLNTNTVDLVKLVDNIHNLQASLREKYGDFPNSTELLQQNRSR